MKKNQFIFRWFTYFRHGYGTYLAFGIGLMNFVAIQYRLLIEQVNILEVLFPTLTNFVVVFILTFIPITALIGRASFKKGPYATESSVTTLANPFFRDLAKAIILLSEEKNEEAKKVLERWTKQ